MSHGIICVAGKINGYFLPINFLTLDNGTLIKNLYNIIALLNCCMAKWWTVFLQTINGSLLGPPLPM